MGDPRFVSLPYVLTITGSKFALHGLPTSYEDGLDVPTAGLPNPRLGKFFHTLTSNRFISNKLFDERLQKMLAVQSTEQPLSDYHVFWGVVPLLVMFT